MTDVTASPFADALRDRYLIERELGRGGMAAVYLARDLKHDRPVALKVLRPELAASLGPERFQREIRFAARLQHPHILSVHDSGEAAGQLWFSMPYVEGESLRTRLTREGQLPIEAALRITSEAAQALQFAHEHGVIHRDIKPENLMLTTDGNTLVADFGIARALAGPGEPDERLTETGLSLGTPRYMSPEQASADRALDARTDVYSLGCVLYEMLAGHPPFLGATAQEILARHALDPVPPLRAARGTVPEAVERSIMRALAKVPADRFATAAQFAQALTPSVTAPGAGPTIVPPVAAQLPAPSPIPEGIDTTVAKALAKVPADRFAGAAEFPAAVAAGEAGPTAGWRRRRLAVAASVAGAVALAGIAALWHPWRRPATAAPPGADVASVAVLPFENLTGSPGDQYLSDGMTEEVIGQLAQVGGLKVISRTSTEALKGTHLSLRQIGDTLGVRHILEGSVRHAGNRIRVAVDLIDATTDAHVWASSYDRDLTDVFAVQEEIARHVADSLVSTVGMHPAVGRVSRTEQPGAYEAYLRGRSLMYRRTREALRGALEQFQQAIAQDSAYAPAYAGLASMYSLWGDRDYRGLDPYEAYGRALAMADRAIALDADLGEAYAARGHALTRAWAPAEPIWVDFKRALALRPNSADGHQWYAGFLSREGRHDEALAEMERAVALDPLAPGVRTGFSVVALAARRYDVAAREAARALALEPGLSMEARGYQAVGDLLSGNAAHCATLSLGPGAGVRAMCLHSLGRLREAAQIADSLGAAFTAGTAGDSIYSPVTTARGLAAYYAWTGNAEESLAWFERSYAPLPGVILSINSGIYDKVRNDASFKAGLQRLRTQVYDRVQRARLGVRLK